MRTITLCLLSLVLWPTFLLAQTTATLSGSVVDATAAPVVGAQLSLSNAVTGFRKDTATNAAGAFQFSNIPLQSYRLTIQAEGFQTESQDVELRSNVPVALPVRLQVARR